MATQEIKLEIKRLRRLKKFMRPNTSERIDIHRKIKALQGELNKTQEQNKEKESVILEILKLKPDYIKNCNIDYTKHSLDDLKRHLKRISRCSE